MKNLYYELKTKKKKYEHPNKYYERDSTGEERMGMKRRDRGSDYISTNNEGITEGLGDKRQNLSLSE